jgi:anti-anti-sigma factor
MSPNHLDVQRRLRDGVAILDLRGEIDALAEPRLTTAYVEAEQTGAETILLNFAQVDYINSTGIALIVGLLARARIGHRRLLACGLSEHYTEIFTITRLAEFMALFQDEGEVLARTA